MTGRAFTIGLIVSICSLMPRVASAQDLARQGLVVVKVPASAELYFGKTLTKSTGEQRVWLTPPLPVGKSFEYELHAVWKEGGETRKASQIVVVRAGGRTEVDLTRPNEAAVEPKAPETKTPENVPSPKPENKGAATKGKTRTFVFTYEALITDLPKDKQVRIWLPVPPDNDVQDVRIESKELPGKEKMGRDREYGNQILYVEGQANEKGELPLKMTYHVTRKEVRTDPENGVAIKPGASEKIARFLAADKMVPIGGKTLSIIDETKLPARQASIGKLVYDAVNTHMKYDKSGTGWGRGDAYWACDSKYGNCTDFHSLFQSVVRSQKIPSKFEIGFPLPPERGMGKIGGYHCWAYFLPDGQGWVPVDISEANRNPSMRDYYFGNLTENRVLFSTGRDIDLVPQQDGPPLNYFVYPYVEVDGQPHPLEKITRTYTYQDVQK